ncbi:MAG: hypothetical protein HS111_16045 [Kofleriaceae bacterium]|nr:hypothetical protein [Kofleriaceae bacterium]
MTRSKLDFEYGAPAHLGGARFCLARRAALNVVRHRTGRLGQPAVADDAGAQARSGSTTLPLRSPSRRYHRPRDLHRSGPSWQ